MPAYYPVYLDLRGRRCVLVGGNDVAEEKLPRLLNCGADVVVIGPDATDRISDMADAGEIEWVRRDYRPGDLDGAFIAIVADTDDSAVNTAVSEEAGERGIPLNVVDVTHLCSWIAPAVVRRGEVMVAVSTGGASPALARRFREQLSGTNRIPTGLGVMEMADLAPLLSEGPRRAGSQRAASRRRPLAGVPDRRARRPGAVRAVRASDGAPERRPAPGTRLRLRTRYLRPPGGARGRPGAVLTGQPTMTSRQELRIGARSSPLSLAQAEEVAAPLRRRFPDRRFEVATLSTAGDRDRRSSLASLGRGAFVKEIEVALLDGRIDVAVHSAKDVPSDLPDGLTLAGTVPRQNPRDVLVDRWSLPLDELPPGARIGTSSPRRTAQIRARRPDIELTPIRGNVGTRLEKAGGPDYDGAVLAAAGLARLGRLDEVAQYLPVDLCTPDVGQGTLAVEVREDDRELIEMLALIDDAPTSISLRAERSFLAALRGGCTVPIAAYARIEGGRLRITSMAATPDGSRIYRKDGEWSAERPEEAGRRMAEALLESGAREIVEQR